MNVDWTACLGPNTRIPHDVIFTFPEEEDYEDIGAHKLLLAMASEVFFSQFFGPMAEAKDVIAVVDTRREVFNVMVEFIYNKNPVWDKFTKCETYFEIYQVADFYLIESLKAAVEDAVRKVKISEANFEEVSLCADRNGHFDKFSASVLETCALFLSENYGSYEKILQFVGQYKGSSSILVQIMRLVKTSKASLKSEKCTFSLTGFNFFDRGYFICHDCFAPDDDESTICKFCIESCHRGHNVSGPVTHGEFSAFYCDCGAGNLRRKKSCRNISEQDIPH